MLTRTQTIPVPANLREVANDSEDREMLDLELIINEYETLDEFAQECGGEDKALIIVNRFRSRGAVQAAKNKINNSVSKIPNGDEKAYQELLSKAQEMAEKYRFEVGDGVSAKEVKDGVLAARERLLKMSPEDRSKMSAEELLASLGLM